MFQLGDNVKIINHPHYAPYYLPYIGKAGAITDENIVGQSRRYQVRFADGKMLWFFESELQSLWSGQKIAHQNDLLRQYENGDYFDLKTSLVKAGLVILLSD